MGPEAWPPGRLQRLAVDARYVPPPPQKTIFAPPTC